LLRFLFFFVEFVCCHVLISQKTLTLLWQVKKIDVPIWIVGFWNIHGVYLWLSKYSIIHKLTNFLVPSLVLSKFETMCLYPMQCMKQLNSMSSTYTTIIECIVLNFYVLLSYGHVFFKENFAAHIELCCNV
jgi:hypothetical protein